jgi:nucleoside-diphosphate-sugar epimerase
MRCLVTGASGHVGSYLARCLIQHGAEVFVLVRPQSDLWRLADVMEQVTVLHGDLSNVPAAGGISEAAPDVVFHLAWYGVTNYYRNHPEQIIQNVTGSLQLFQAAQAAGCRCWVGVGSQAEYGPHSGLLTEDLPVQPTTAYGVSKLCVGMLTEKLCEMAGIRYVWLRLLATYGPKDDERHLIPTVIQQLLAGKKPALTPGEQKWDYLYVEDAAEAIYRVAITAQAQGVYNLGSGEAYPVRDIVTRIRDMIDPSLPLGLGDVPYRPDQVMHLQAGISRLQSAIDWAPTTDLDEGLQHTIDWYRSKPGLHRAARN